MVTATISALRHVVVLLIKASHYDDEGFPYRFKKGVLPSDTLKTLFFLTGNALGKILPPDITHEVLMFEDGITSHARLLEKLGKRFPQEDTKLIVCLVGVQTAQFPRACDIIRRWQGRGATCVIGGAHLSGMLATMYDGISDPSRPNVPCPHVIPADIQTLFDNGVVVFQGEAEAESPENDVWRKALSDIIAGNARSLYKGGRPDLRNTPLPRHPPDYLDCFVSRVRTINAGRGCPHKCNFCSLINFQGRKMRAHDPSEVVSYIKEACEEDGMASFFITDDNFSRNTHWRTILDQLIELRQQGFRFRFMVQADATAPVEFIQKLGLAGCSQIFFGVESLNPKNLEAASKSQNKVEKLEQLFDLCHKCGVAVHAAYIIGFPHDTPESVEQDLDLLIKFGADQASFFILIPAPGSVDYVVAYTEGKKMDIDWNKYDAFHPVAEHPLMSRDQWFALYQRAWRKFYRPVNMIAALKRVPAGAKRWQQLSVFLWYWWSVRVEQTHPMIAGWLRNRSLTDRRPGSPPIPMWRFFFREAWHRLRYFGYMFAVFYIFQHVVFETEFAPKLSAKRKHLSWQLQGLRDWLSRTFGREVTRQWLNEFWIRYGRHRWQLLNPLKWHWHILMIPRAVSEIVYTFKFVMLFMRLLRTTT